MKTSTQPFDLSEHYFGLLKTLRPEIKIDLIKKLTASLKEKRPRMEETLQTSYEKYRPGETAEEIIADITSARSSNRIIEPL